MDRINEIAKPLQRSHFSFGFLVRKVTRSEENINKYLA